MRMITSCVLLIRVLVLSTYEVHVHKLQLNFPYALTLNFFGSSEFQSYLIHTLYRSQDSWYEEAILYKYTCADSFLVD